MSDRAIGIKGLGKEYQIGVRGRGYTTIRESVVRAATAPLRRLRELSGRGRTAEGSFWALRDVGFEVKVGEVVGVIGRNGAGKSTLLKVLSRIVEPTTGQVELNGRVGSLLEVGTGFHPELTGRENVYLNGAILGMSRREVARKFDDIVAFSEVGKFLETPVKKFSSGMYTRLAFAVAAHLEPEILIVDEVLAVGDAQFQEKCVGKMQEVARGGRTVLFVSHNMAAIEGLCNRCVVLDAGQVAFDGTAAEAAGFYHRGLSESRTTAFHAADRLGVRPTDSRFISAVLTGTGNDGLPDGAFRVGSPLTFRIDCYVGDSEAAVEVGVGINTARGVRVTTAHTRSADASALPRLASGPMRYTCRLPDLKLAPGIYTVRLAMKRDGRMVDEIERAIQFEVLSTNHRGNLGKFYSGVVVTDQEWQAEVTQLPSADGPPRTFEGSGE